MEVDRARAMADRVNRGSVRAGVSPSGCELLQEAFASAIAKRVIAFPEPHPDFLHPGRTALILLEDARVTDPNVIAAGILYDSEDPQLSASPSEVEALCGEEAAAIARELPEPGAGDAEALESLVIADSRAVTVAIAERLDYARHVHLGPRERWAPRHQSVLNVYLPVARRVQSPLAARLDAWAEAIERRLVRQRG